jgi:hypothetical protein
LNEKNRLLELPVSSSLLETIGRLHNSEITIHRIRMDEKNYFAIVLVTASAAGHGVTTLKFQNNGPPYQPNILVVSSHSIMARHDNKL